MFEDKNSITSHIRNGQYEQSRYETPDSPFREALKAITGQEPPEYVVGYNCGDIPEERWHDLQEWASNAVVDAGFEWMTGIGTVEAAEHMVKCAEENGNIGTNPRERHPEKKSEKNSEDRENLQALLFMEAWGSGDALVDEPFDGRYKYAIEDYCPEFIDSDLPEDFQDHHGGVVTVLCVGEPEVEGYEIASRYVAGEQECPGMRLEFEEHHTQEGGCPFCGGDDYIYWGDEWGVYVLVPVGVSSEDE